MSVTQCTICGYKLKENEYQCPKGCSTEGLHEYINEDMYEKLQKNLWSLLPLSALDLAAQAFTYGAKKYERDNWKKYKSHVYYDAMFRHLKAIELGEPCDEESRLSHLSHFLADAIMFTFLKNKEDEDDKESSSN